MKKVVELELIDEPLLSRMCPRCSSQEYRAIAHEDGEAFGSVFGYGSAMSQTAVPLAICLGCSRIVMLV